MRPAVTTSKSVLYIDKNNNSLFCIKPAWLWLQVVIDSTDSAVTTTVSVIRAASKKDAPLVHLTLKRSLKHIFNASVQYIFNALTTSNYFILSSSKLDVAFLYTFVSRKLVELLHEAKKIG
jgi:hypothetical protein